MTEKRKASRGKSGKDKSMTPFATPQNGQHTISVPMQDLLGEKLRAYYDEVVREPVPDRFEQLLKELEDRSNPKKND